MTVHDGLVPLFNDDTVAANFAMMWIGNYPVDNIVFQGKSYISSFYFCCVAAALTQQTSANFMFKHPFSNMYSTENDCQRNYQGRERRIG